MEINLAVVLIILFVHWLADFVLQTDWQAQNKSKNNIALTLHVLSYTIVWCFVSLWLLGPAGSSVFAIITFITHWFTDYYTSRLNSKLYAAGKIHYFFVSIGFDQFLHYAQLLLTYQLLK